MPQESAAIGRDLAKVIEGDVLFDEISRVLYSTASCIFQIKPLGVVAPKNKEDVVKVVQYADANGISITARGAGSGRAGQAIGRGITLDFTKYMNCILEINAEESFVRIQPGVVLAHLNDALKKHNRFFPPDPSSGDFCTLGGMIANNSSGAHSVKYGATKDYVISLEAVLANGEVIVTHPRDVGTLCIQNVQSGQAEAQKLQIELLNLLRLHSDAVQKARPRTTKNCAGYNLWGAIKDDSFDLAQLLVGSEGTLAIITEAKLKIAPPPARRSSALLTFNGLDNIGTATCRILNFNPSMVEIMERPLLDAARKLDSGLDSFLPTDFDAVLLIEYEGESEAEIEAAMGAMRNAVVKEGLASEMVLARNAEEQEILLKVRKAAGSILMKTEGPKRPVPFIEDAAVHPSKLGEYMKGMRSVFRKYGVAADIYGHAGDGNLHVYPLLDLKDPQDIARMKGIADEVHDLTLAMKGTISAEHGDGLARTPFLREQYGEVYPVLGKIKRLFDPKGILNPGRIVESDTASPSSESPAHRFSDLRYGADYSLVKTDSTFDSGSMTTAIEKCHGCGTCRSYCPVFKELGDEKASPRAKANLLRAMISGKLDPAEHLSSEVVKKIADLCINCRRCHTLCPTQVDIPQLCLRMKEHYAERKGLPLRDRALSRSGCLSSKAHGLIAPAANCLLQNRQVRIAMERALGIDRKRTLPPFCRKTLIEWVVDRQSGSRSSRAAVWQPTPNETRGDLRSGNGVSESSLCCAAKVAYFPGCFANHYDPEGEGRATIELLEKCGAEVIVTDLKCCGAPQITIGDAGSIRDDIRYNVDALATLIENGCDIVVSSPTCGIAIKQEYPEILADDKAKLVAERTYDIHEYLLRLHREGKLRNDFSTLDITVVYHKPCHLIAQNVVKEPVELMRLIPGLLVKEIEDNCCGMAGTFGLKHQNYDLAMKIGGSVFEAIKETKADLIVTSCGACKMQLEHGTGMSVVHPIELLNRA